MLIAGFGGQGVLMIGQLLCQAACFNNKEALFLPKYGAEQRGGTARCDVAISDAPIYSPFTDYFDILMALNQPSMDKFSGVLKPGGILLANSSRCKAVFREDDISVLRIPADEIAERIGSEKVANIVMLGAYVKKSGMLTKEEVLTAINDKLARKQQLLEMNYQALQAGMDIV